MFKKSGFHAFWTRKYMINLIDYLNFFEHWNEILLKSKNGDVITRQAKIELEKFYSENARREESRSERMWSLISSLLVALLSAALGYVFGLLAHQ